MRVTPGDGRPRAAVPRRAAGGVRFDAAFERAVRAVRAGRAERAERAERTGRTDRAGRAGRDERGVRRDDEAAAGAGGAARGAARVARAEDARTVDGVLAALTSPPASPGRAEAAARAATSPALAAAVARIAVLVGDGALPAVSLRVGGGVEIRLEQARQGIEVEFRCLRGPSPLAEAELPGLLAALRGSGIRVARSAVTRGGRAGRPSLTARRSSATTAGDSGTVAKW